MKPRSIIPALTALILAALTSVVLAAPSPAVAAGTMQISGVAEFDTGTCDDAAGAGADFALLMGGDLEGCLYTFVQTSTCTPSGTYNETGHEIFVGEYSGDSGTFETTYRFTAKYGDCANLLDEKVGRCHHPIAANSGTGVFAGVSGRLHFKDDVVAGDFPYAGQLKF